jgi:hypothetical protein
MTGRCTRETVVQVLDSGDALEIFASNLTRIEDHGPTSRLVFGSRRRQHGELVETVTIAIVVPTAAVSMIARQLLAGDVGCTAGNGEDGEPVRLAS